MVKTRQEIELIIKNYIAILENLGIQSERIILFGSYARGLAQEDSDIDLLVISDDFESKNLRERLEILGLAAARIMQPIQAYGITPHELNNKERSAFINEILEYGTTAA